MTLAAIDPEGATLSYSLSGSVDDSLFALDSSTGALSFKSAPDFEAPADSGSDNTYNIEVSVTDGSDTASQSVAVTVTDADEAPAFTSATTASVAENQTAVMTVAAIDPESSALTYSLTGSVDDSLFTLDATSGALSFKSAPDFEAPGDSGSDNTYNIEISASDGTTMVSQSIAASVTDVDETPSFTSGATVSIAENQTAVMTVAATDPEGATLSYSLSGSVDDSLFALDSSTGALSFKSAPDFEAPADSGSDNTYNIEVSVTDGTDTASQSITVTVTDVNEAPVFSSAATASIAENLTAVMTVAASDAEGDTLTYGLTGSVDDGLFTIDSTSGALSFVSAPDFEAPADSGSDNTYEVEISVSDGTTTVSQSVAVSVTDVDEAPVFTTPALAFVDENQTLVMAAAAGDPEGATVTYSLSGSVDDSLFTLDANTGVLSFISAPDFEAPGDNGADNTYDIEVTASDGAKGTAQSIAVAVRDVLEFEVASGGVKTLSFSWSGFDGAAYYKLMVNPDGASGFVQEGTDITATSVDVVVPVHLTDWINASYLLEAYDSAGTLLASSSETAVTDLMLSSIGYFKASNTGAGDFFGHSVALSADGNTLAVGAVYEDSSTSGVNSTADEGATDSGAAYLFRYDTGTGNWVEEAYFKASNTGAGDFFGRSVALSGDGNALAVGAYGEDSSTTGVNSTPDEGASASGAAYLFRYDTGTGNWAEEAYIKASNAGANDRFGASVALSADGNTLAVGAGGEDSSTTGVNSTPDGGASSSGAAYLFRYDTGTGNWAEEAYLKASNTGSGDAFGWSVALSTDGNTLAVGAVYEASSTTGVNSTPDEGATYSGAAYLFRYDTGTGNWAEEAYVKASNTGAGDRFGVSVALSTDGDTLAVGAYGEASSTTGVNSTPDEGASSSGAVYLY